MIFLKTRIFRRQSTLLKIRKSNKGAITVEYAFGMALAAFFMIGVELMFRRMAIDIIDFFKQMVTQFPNI